MTADVTAAMARLRKLVTDAKPALMDDPAWSAQFFRVDDDLALVAQALAERDERIALLRTRYDTVEGICATAWKQCDAQRGRADEAEAALAAARRQAIEEVSAWLTHKRGCMAKYVLADGRHCTCDCGLAALRAPASRSGCPRHFGAPSMMCSHPDCITAPGRGEGRG